MSCAGLYRMALPATIAWAETLVCGRAYVGRRASCRLYRGSLTRDWCLTIPCAFPAPSPQQLGGFAAVHYRARRAGTPIEDFDMSRRCDLTGKGAQTGHKVSHSNRKTKRRFLPNLCNVTFMSDALNRSVKLRVSANALKSVDHRGGLDAFLMKARDEELSHEALELKRAIAKKRASA